METTGGNNYIDTERGNVEIDYLDFLFLLQFFCAIIIANLCNVL